MECTLLREEPGGAEYTTVAIEHAADPAAVAAAVAALRISSFEPAARVPAAAVSKPAPLLRARGRRKRRPRASDAAAGAGCGRAGGGVGLGGGLPGLRPRAGPPTAPGRRRWRLSPGCPPGPAAPRPKLTAGSEPRNGPRMLGAGPRDE